MKGEVVLMKKQRKAAIKYYITLLSGVLMFLPFVVFDTLFPGSVNKYGIFFVIWLVIAFMGWLYAIKKSVDTKEFLAYEIESEKKEKAFFIKNKEHLNKIIKICLIIDIPMTILAIIFYIMYICYGVERAVVGNYYPLFWIFYNIFLFSFKHFLKRY